MDVTNTKYRIRQCSNCPEDLKYFCLTCLSNLCLQCGENHMMKNSNKDLYNVITYREKSNYLQNHEICVRHPSNVYTEYCELCKIPICTDCTDHRNHRQTDVGTAYEENRRTKEIIIKKIQNEALSIRYALLVDIELDFKTVISDVAHVNSKILRNSEKLMGFPDNELDGEKLFVKLKKNINKYIASTHIYEHIYEKSSYFPIKFLLSVKKRQSKTLKKYGQITLTPCKSLKRKTITEKLLTIISTDNGKRLTEREKLTRVMGVQFNKMLRAIAFLLVQMPTLVKSLPRIGSEGNSTTQGSKYF